MRKTNIEKKASYFNELKSTCVNCGRKQPIRYDKDRVMCTWCKHYIFRTEKEYYDYYNRQKFRKQLRRVMAKNEYNERTCDN